MEEWLDPLYDAEGMRGVDAWAIEDRGIPSLELMETAGRALAEAALARARSGPARVVCGKGNNGGDGLVAARHLRRMGIPAEALLLWPAGELSADAAANRERFEGELRELDIAQLPRALAGSGVIVDAVLGTGFSGTPQVPVSAAIEAINGAGAPVVAADVPSGVDASSGEIAGGAVQASATVSFHAAKLGHWVAPGKASRGELLVVGIGIPDGAPTEPVAGLITDRALERLPARGADSTKFSSGRVLIAGGSRGLSGAVCMAAEAAGRAGAGYVTVAVPAELESIFEIKLTEAMSLACPSSDGALAAAAAEPIADAGERAGAVILGPGLGRGDEQVELVARVSELVEAPLVIDADGLNSLAGRVEALGGRPGPTLLTPHAGELGRLLERDAAEVAAHRVASAREAAERAGAIVVLKGDDTIIAADDGRLAVNGLASPGLATAGTGDVLSGMIGALIARGVEPFHAACAAVRAHARAGVDAARRIGAPESVSATDVIASIPAGLGTAGEPR
jgi:NAD(P)H-hydrate epimerase